jgi:hypothetical protein
VTGTNTHARPTTCQQKILQRAQRRAKTSKLFDSDIYLALHPDLMDAQVDATEHFLSYGFKEGRRTAQPHAGPRLLGELKSQYEDAARVYLSSFERAQAEQQKHHSFAQKNRVAVVCHTEGSPHMLPIARALCHALQAAGLKCTTLHQGDKVIEHVTCPIVVAPHEFFQLPRHGYASTGEFLYRAIAYNTEQLPSPWFSSGLKFLLCSRGVVDINFLFSAATGHEIWAPGNVRPSFARSAWRMNRRWSAVCRMRECSLRRGAPRLLAGEPRQTGAEKSARERARSWRAIPPIRARRRQP